MVERDVKEVMIQLLKEDAQVHEIIYSVFERSEILKEIKLLREDMNRRFEAIDKRFEETLHYMNKRFEDVNRRFEEFREDLHRSISAIGLRWGDQFEDVFYSAMKELLRKKFGVDIKKWRYYDKEGFVSGVPRGVEANIKISDSEHILIKVKASVSEADVSEIKKIGELYQKVTGVAPKLVLVAAFPHPKAEDLAGLLDITIYSYLHE